MQIYTVYLTFSALLAVHKEFWVKNITVILSCCVCSVEVSLLEHVAVMFSMCNHKCEKVLQIGTNSVLLRSIPDI